MSEERRMEYQSLNGIREDIGEIKTAIEKIELTLNGQGDKPGMKGRLDRVEQSMSTISRVVWIFIGLACTVIVGRVMGAF